MISLSLSQHDVIKGTSLHFFLIHVVVVFNSCGNLHILNCCRVIVELKPLYAKYINGPLAQSTVDSIPNSKLQNNIVYCVEF